MVSCSCAEGSMLNYRVARYNYYKRRVANPGI